MYSVAIRIQLYVLYSCTGTSSSTGTTRYPDYKELHVTTAVITLQCNYTTHGARDPTQRAHGHHTSGARLSVCVCMPWYAWRTLCHVQNFRCRVAGQDSSRFNTFSSDIVKTSLGIHCLSFDSHTRPRPSHLRSFVCVYVRPPTSMCSVPCVILGTEIDR